jgi:hypothetical protein
MHPLMQILSLVDFISLVVATGPLLFKGEIITKCKHLARSLKNFLLENH